MDHCKSAVRQVGIMEIASCAVGAVSLALQLPKAVKEVYTLLDSIKDAPRDLAALKRELEISEWIICGMSAMKQSYGTNEEAFQVVRLIQEEYWEVLNDLRSLVTTLTYGLDSRSTARRRWAKVDWACRAEKFGKLKIRLHDAKLNFLLVQKSPDFSHSVSFQAAQRIQESELTNTSIMVHAQTDSSEATYHPEAQALDFAFTIGVEQISLDSDMAVILEDATVTASSELLSIEQSLCDSATRTGSNDQLSTFTHSIEQHHGDELPAQSCYSHSKVRMRQIGPSKCKIIRNKLGEIHITAMTCKVIPSWNLEGNDPPKGNPAKIERRTSYIFIPHKWVVKLGMRKMLAFSSQVRPMNINVYKIRPDTFTIFEYCRNGNFDGVKSLLKLGQASIKDINEFGETPLHLAASWCQTEICTLLLDAGADTTLVDLRGSSK
ncbi:uncharacterized protein RCO7_05857 [Rhynchosporium graminicola]|uniref:Uncharacterized protein n=1 Tax=Rhynchosporium graminicola TaxID=2792576 RepID=A0A1E1KAT9_9HELO|nr:uncharacterized protein RCO7_05857 [Rhynchosporium commune]